MNDEIKKPTTAEGNVAAEKQSTVTAGKKPKRHLIKNTFLRRVLKTLLCVLVIMLLIPVLIYLPPVQSVLKTVACDIASDATGMHISIDRFRLKFPIDVALDGVVVIEASGDTMVRAKEAVVDVKLRPLLDLNLKLNSLILNEGMYRMVSADSSMILRAEIGHLAVEGNTGMNLKTSEINLSEARLRDGDVRLFMNVWKAKQEPKDTTSQPFLIKVNYVDLQSVRFAMSMLPTIDTLDARLQHAELKNGIVDLRNNIVTAGYIGAAGGKVLYVTPTPEYVAAHPAPVDTLPVQESKPMIVKGDSISVTDFSAVYAMKGAEPQPGFDANYISVSGFNLSIKDFYNKAAELRVPIYSLTASERSGLQITRGEGIVAMDADGINVDGFELETANSSLDVDAYVSYGMMAMETAAPMNISAEASVGFADVVAFMPSLKPMLTGIPQNRPMEMVLAADGSLASLDVDVLSVSIPNCISLIAKGSVNNPLDMKKIRGEVEINGNVMNSSLTDQLVAGTGVNVPPMRLVGNASVDGSRYAADLQMLTPSGDVTLDGDVNLTSEGYFADLMITDLNVGAIMPDLGIGLFSGQVKAEGAGFDPMNPATYTHINAEISQFEYGGRSFGNVTADVSLQDGEFTADVVSFDPYCDVDLRADGRLETDYYEFDVVANLNNVDLQDLGFSDAMNSGNGEIRISGWASPEKWLYDVDLAVDNFNWNLPGQYIHLPNGLTADFVAAEKNVDFELQADLLQAKFSSPCRLDTVVDRFMVGTDSIMNDLADNQLNVRNFQPLLPKFDLSMQASGRGMMGQFLAAADMHMDSVTFALSNTDKIVGDAGVYRLKSGTLQLDTITLNLKERGRLIDYRIHLGNRRGTLDEFAQVDLRGYMGGNRASASLTQRNIDGQMGYRLGFTAAMLPEGISLHFTPLDATIAYLPWTFNEDNHLQYNFNNQVDANLVATSNDSHIKLLTAPNERGDNALNVNIANLHIEDFLSMSVFAPPISGSLNSDMSLVYRGNAILGGGKLNVTELNYDRQRLGTFDFNFKAGLDLDGNTGAMLSLLVDEKEVMTGRGYVRTDSITSDMVSKIDLTLNEFPLVLANPFLGEDVASLKGSLNGGLKMTGSLVSPLLNGNIYCRDASIYMPMMGSTFSLDTVPVTVTDNIIEMRNFKVIGSNENPLTVDGRVDARNLSDIAIDLGMTARNMQLVGSTKKSRSDIYGKLFVNLDATAKGKLSHFDVNASLSVLSSTDVYYTMTDAESVIAQQTSGEVVKFVVFADSLNTAVVDTVPEMMNMKVTANLNIVNGAKATVNLSSNGTDKVEIYPSGNLVYTQNYMGDMRLNGQLNVNSGFARYNIPIMGEKKFTFQPGSSALWNGDLMNPTLNFHAVDQVKASVKQDSQNTRNINFDVSLSVTNTLSSPKIMFDLSTDDDVSIQNELQTMSADQRSNQAMNLLLYNTYTGSSGSSTNFSAEGQLYSFLTSQLNSWAAKTIQGVDLSFGIDQNNELIDGQNSSSMSYSYQVSKSLFDNRFKIVVGGNYSTDASADENFAQNLISDISFEYTIKQTNNIGMYVKLFRHTGFESILEGEITETGAGFVLKRKLDNLRSLFRLRRPKRKAKTDTVAVDTVVPVVVPAALPTDSLDGFDVEPITEGYDVLN